MKATKGGCYGSTDLTIVVPGASWRKIFVEKAHRTKNKDAAWREEDEVFCFCFSSLTEPVIAAARSGQGRAVS